MSGATAGDVGRNSLGVSGLDHVMSLADHHVHHISLLYVGMSMGLAPVDVGGPVSLPGPWTRVVPGTGRGRDKVHEPGWWRYYDQQG